MREGASGVGAHLRRDGRVVEGGRRDWLHLERQLRRGGGRRQEARGQTDAQLAESCLCGLAGEVDATDGATAAAGALQEVVPEGALPVAANVSLSFSAARPNAGV